MKILNLYAGIGGNRKLWKDVDVTAIENNSEIAALYKGFFPKDDVIVADAHYYLLKNYNNFDFIWSSPPCQTHSKQRAMGVDIGQNEPKYPNMQLYEEIIFLKRFAKCKWVIENVDPYYNILIDAKKIGRHYFWSNFYINTKQTESDNIKWGTIDSWKELKGFDLTNVNINHRKDQILRNCVNSELGLHIFNEAFKIKQATVGDFTSPIGDSANAEEFNTPLATHSVRPNSKIP